MAEIAILGYGTIGSGVFYVLKKNGASIDKRAAQHVGIKKVLDLRDFPGDPVEEYLTKDIDEILNDKDISVIVEVMGGIEPAYCYVKRSILSGKSVVTSNKELVAKHGAELLELARENRCNFLFEASVGGGIPIIRPLNQSLTADEIYEISGILNGTTNYILTRMEDGADYSDALKEAQELGYAERNPDADVLGHDACRKLAILLSLALGRQVDFENIHTEGITEITLNDIAYAAQVGGRIKLVASAKIADAVSAKVQPVIVSAGNPLLNVSGVFNAILIKGDIIGEVMFYGRGAGKLPTASAVAADIIDAVKHANTNILQFWSKERHDFTPSGHLPCARLVIASYNTNDNNSADNGREKTVQAIKEIFGVSGYIEMFENELAFLTDTDEERKLSDKIMKLGLCEGVRVRSFEVQ